MTDRGFLYRMKELYEKEGGIIVRYIDNGKKIRTWILDNRQTENSIPQKVREQIQHIKVEVMEKGAASSWDDKGNLLYLEMAGGEDRLVICGAGYVGYALTRLAVFAGIRTIVLEDRKEFADRAKEAGANEVLCCPFHEGIRLLKDSGATAYVVMTRGHAFDQRCLLEISRKKSYYVGMMGSRTRAGMMRQELQQAGVEAEWTEKIHAPIGLDIGAQTPEEIAVSVLAEVLMERNRQGLAMRTGYEVFQKALMHMKEGETYILSTILERQGSAPRKEGTHFIVTESGQCFGTIGGGKLEADIVQASMEMIDQGESVRIEESDLNNRDAASEGLVCGGKVKVLMEMGINCVEKDS